MNGSIPDTLGLLSLRELYLSNNSLCYSAVYSEWAPTTDYKASSLCENCLCLNNGTCVVAQNMYCCICDPPYFGEQCQYQRNYCASSPCKNGATCNDGFGSIKCVCAPGYQGPTCEAIDSTAPCPTGMARNTSGVCDLCPAGTYVSNKKCSPCTAGTASSVVGSSTIGDCHPCPPGQFTNVSASSTCLTCDVGSCPVRGSLMASAKGIQIVPFKMTKYDRDGQVASGESPKVNDMMYVGIVAGFIVLTGFVSLVFRNQLRRPFHLVSAILKTPFFIIKVLPSSWELFETPSFFRGMMGVWVVGGVLVMTVFQINVFVLEGRTELTAVQPGATYTNGSVTSVTTARVFLSLAIFQTQVVCDDPGYLMHASFGTGRGEEIDFPMATCYVDPTIPSLNLTADFAIPIQFAIYPQLQFRVTSLNRGPIFTHGIHYNMTLTSFEGTRVVITETLSNDPVGQLTGDMEVSLSAIPTEYIYDDETTSIGYTYSYYSSKITTSDAMANSLSLTWDFPVPAYFYQIRNIQSIPTLTFLTNVLGLGGAVITGGSLIANLIAYAHLHWTNYSSGRGSGAGGVNKDHLVPLI